MEGQTSLSAPPAGVMGQMQLSQSLSLKPFPRYETTRGSALTAVGMWGIGHPLRVNSASSREGLDAPGALWGCLSASGSFWHPDVACSFCGKPILSFSY